MTRAHRRSPGPAAAAGLVVVPSLAALLTMVLAWTLPASAKLYWNVSWSAAAVAAVAGMLLARHSAPAGDRARWTLWTAAAGCWLLGQVLWDVYAVVGFPGAPSPADVAWWAFALLLFASLARSRARSRSVRIVAAFEALPVTAAAIALSVALLWHDASGSTLPLGARLSALTYPALYLPAAVLMLQSMFAGSLRGERSGSMQLALSGMTAQAVAFALWSEALLDRTSLTARPLLDSLWAAGLLLMALGGLLAYQRPQAVTEADEPTSRGGVLPAAMFFLLIGAFVRAQLVDSQAGPVYALGAGLVCTGVALIVRGVLLERRLRVLLDRERTARAALGERESELARLNAQLIEDSRRDPLTGMRNRRALADDLLELQTQRAQSGESFALALCDVDHFKAYNDGLGHLAGDQALRTIAAKVQSALPQGDLAYRFGGEELLLVLRSADAEAATATAERVRLAVQRAALDHPQGIDGRLTLSFGIAAGDEDSSVMLARADAALYEAKRAGRNRVVTADAHAPAPDTGLHRPPAHEPVPRHLRSMLAVSRAAASGQGPLPILQALAETLRSELSFHIVAVNLVDEARQDLTCVIVLGDEDARRTLLGTVSPWRDWERVLASPDHQRGGAIWLPDGTDPFEESPITWVPSAVAAPGADSWHPDDMLLLPVRGQDGRSLAVISVDQPASGRRPDDGQIAFLMAAADHAGLALEQAQRGAAEAAAAQEQSAELKLAAVMLLAETLDLRDPGTARHSRTVGAFARRTAEALGLPEDRVQQIHAGGVVHDLGKLGIADAILYKPGRLSDDEWREIQRHPEIGARILDHAGLPEIAGWVRAHHERIDGRGYPAGLRGSDIPLEARILSVADAYEAMTADRPYRAGMGAAAAIAELRRCAGDQFDPRVVEAFLSTLHTAPVPAAALAAA